MRWCCLALTLTLTANLRAGEWPQFRGPTGTGVVTDAAPEQWSADKNVRWKVAIPGTGWASPVVWGDKVFIATAVSDKQEKPKPFNPGAGGGGGFGMGNQKPPDAVYRWQLHCVNAADGKTLWQKTLAEKKPAIATHSTNTYASETPVVDAERVYAYFGMTGLYCLDHAGKIVWQKDLGAYKMAVGFGTGSSPTLDEQHLYVQCDNEEKSFLVALDKKTGDEKWRTARASKSSWSTPFVWKTKGRTDLVCCGEKSVYAYDPATGKVVWEMKGIDSSFTATPVADESALYFGTAGPTSSAPLYAVKTGATGDISLAKGETSNAWVLWSRTKAGPGMASLLLHDGLLYVPRQGSVSCFDAKTGEPAYSNERLPKGKSVTASPWLAGGKIYLLDESGKTHILAPGRTFKVLGDNVLEEMCWATPAVAGGALYLRGRDHLFCIATK